MRVVALLVVALLVVAVASSGCLAHVVPEKSPRVAVIDAVGVRTFVKDGVVTSDGLLGGGLYDLVKDDPVAADRRGEPHTAPSRAAARATRARRADRAWWTPRDGRRNAAIVAAADAQQATYADHLS